ncbi:hypothetical protein NUW54_g12192 [Trametes sanguinea]|uniref:Uncharacterized protein n=1 Tax=Trametes sanguinea TaxID=158606 RepID=A0ACC1N0K6_9APHY|nr:hypothetical protein NUW54_g12192 [Trametes sanguinea]
MHRSGDSEIALENAPGPGQVAHTSPYVSRTYFNASSKRRDMASQPTSPVVPDRTRDFASLRNVFLRLALHPDCPVSKLVASLSRRSQYDDQHPKLFHSLHQEHSSVLSLAADAESIYTGSQDGQISVWDKTTFKLKAVLRGHTGSVLALEYAADRHWLFSASGQSMLPRSFDSRSQALSQAIAPSAYVERPSGTHRRLL